MWEPRRLTTIRASTTCYKCSLTFFLPAANTYRLIPPNIILSISSYEPHFGMTVSVHSFSNLSPTSKLSTGYRLDGRGSISGRGNRFFSNPQRPDQLWGHLSLLSIEYRGLFSWGLKQLEREAYNSLLSSANVKNGGTIPLLPHTSSWYDA
jgi:hypothetical protein